MNILPIVSDPQSTDLSTHLAHSALPGAPVRHEIRSGRRLRRRRT